MSTARRPYPTDVTDDEWDFVAPYLALVREDAPQRAHDLREVFNAPRRLVKAGCPWRLLPHDFPPWGRSTSRPGGGWRPTCSSAWPTTSGPSSRTTWRASRGNGVVLQAPAAQTFPVTIHSSILFQLAATFQPPYTLNGHSELTGVQTFDLPAGQYVIEYQLPDPNEPGGLTAYTLTFTVMTDGTLTFPAGERGLLVADGVLTLLPPFP